jgi:SulP family sulfate permease
MTAAAMSTNKHTYATIFPPLAWCRSCDRDILIKDFMAALIVVVMLVPQALGYAMVAGMPPYVGLYISILPPLMYCLFGPSIWPPARSSR